MTPPLDLQARNLAEQLKVQHAIHLPRDEAELLLAILYGRPTWDRLVLADTNQTLTEDIPLHSERLAQALKNSLDVNLTTEQAALVLSAPPPAKLTMKGWDARFWRLDLTTEGEALQFLNMRCAGPVRSRPPVLFEMMTLDDVFGVDPDERSLQPAAYLAALAKLALTPTISEPFKASGGPCGQPPGCWSTTTTSRRPTTCCWHCCTSSPIATKVLARSMTGCRHS